jgi:hypothetical protein
LSAGERARNLRQKSREEKINAHFIIPRDLVLFIIGGTPFSMEFGLIRAQGESRAASQH